MIFQHQDHEVFFVEDDDEHFCLISDCIDCKIAHKCVLKEIGEEEQ